MKIRTATVDDADNILRWSIANAERNGFDMRVLEYPTTEVACAENGRPVAYLPIQVAAMLESFAPNPAASAGERRAALYDLLGAILGRVKERGVREVFFLGTDAETNRYAEQLGFQKIEVPVYRIRL